MREDPELVRDAGAAFANTEFYPDDEDNVVVTTHWKAEGLHRYSDKRWIRRQRIGKGGQGAVFLECLQDDDDTKRAVKRIDISDEDIKRAYYIRELEAVAKFSQEGYRDWFVRAYGWYETKRSLYIPMEYLPLGDLRKYIKHHGAIPEQDAQHIAWQIAHALKLMHQEGFAHRDIKPENILIQRHPSHGGEWKIKITDMGISKRINELDGNTTSVKFTPNYRAPELMFITDETEAKAKQADPYPADIWCFGETMYYMLTKEHTFSGPTRTSQCRKYYKGLVPFPRETLQQHSISPGMIDYLTMLLQPQPKDRLSSVAAKIWLESPNGDGRHATQQQVLKNPEMFKRKGAAFNTHKLFESNQWGAHSSSPQPGTTSRPYSGPPAPEMDHNPYSGTSPVPGTHNSPMGRWNEPNLQAPAGVVPSPPGSMFWDEQNYIPPRQPMRLEDIDEDQESQRSETEMGAWTKTEPIARQPSPLIPDPFASWQPPQQSTSPGRTQIDPISANTGQPSYHDSFTGFSTRPQRERSSKGRMITQADGSQMFLLNTDPRATGQTFLGRPLPDAQQGFENSNSESEQTVIAPRKGRHRYLNGFFVPLPDGSAIFILNTDPRVEALTSAGWPLMAVQEALKEALGDGKAAARYLIEKQLNDRGHQVEFVTHDQLPHKEGVAWGHHFANQGDQNFAGPTAAGNGTGSLGSNVHYHSPGGDTPLEPLAEEDPRLRYFLESGYPREAILEAYRQTNGANMEDISHWLREWSKGPPGHRPTEKVEALQQLGADEHKASQLLEISGGDLQNAAERWANTLETRPANADPDVFGAFGQMSLQDHQRSAGDRSTSPVYDNPYMQPPFNSPDPSLSQIGSHPPNYDSLRPLTPFGAPSSQHGMSMQQNNSSPAVFYQGSHHRQDFPGASLGTGQPMSQDVDAGARIMQSRRGPSQFPETGQYQMPSYDQPGSSSRQPEYGNQGIYQQPSEQFSAAFVSSQPPRPAPKQNNHNSQPATQQPRQQLPPLRKDQVPGRLSRAVWKLLS